MIGEELVEESQVEPLVRFASRDVSASCVVSVVCQQGQPVIVFLLTQPYEREHCSLIDVAHAFDLSCFFLGIGLVDTYGIYPRPQHAPGCRPVRDASPRTLESDIPPVRNGKLSRRISNDRPTWESDALKGTVA